MGGALTFNPCQLGKILPQPTLYDRFAYRVLTSLESNSLDGRSFARGFAL